jgi:hypothetical protein
LPTGYRYTEHPAASSNAEFDGELKAREEAKRERHWDPLARQRCIEEMKARIEKQY